MSDAKKVGLIFGVFISFLFFSAAVFAGDATLTWNANTEANLAGYRVYFGTASRTYGPSINVGKVTSHTLTGLANRTYFFAVTAYDAAGKESAFSVEVSKSITTPDTVAPVLSSISAGSITGNSAVITWGTNEPTDTQVQYGTTTAYGASTTRVTTLVTVHSQILTGLQPGTLYHYRVLSRDAAGNLATSLDNTFTTAAPAPAPPPSSSTPGTSATVRLSPTADTFLNVDTSANSTSTTLNTYTWPANRIANAVLMKFTLSSLPAGAVIQSATLNLALVESDTTSDATYNIGVHKIINRNPDLTRATGATYDGTNAWTANSCCNNNYPLAQADISAVYDTEAINKTLGNKVWDITAMVREWMSNPSSNFGLLLNSDPTKGADRYRTFASMEHPTASLRPYLSITYAAADTTAPVISGIAAGSITVNSATITWSTNEAADTQVEYGTTTAYGASTAIVSTLLTAHSQILTGLNPATTYQYRVKSKDAAGNLATSGNGTFTTLALPDTTAPSVPGNLLASVLSAVQINLTWSASTDNVGVAGYRVYRNGVQVGTTATPGYSDTGLLAATLYSYRVAAYDAAGNVSAQSSAINATTLALNPSTTVKVSPAADTFLNVDASVNSTSTTLNTYTWPANRVANAVLMKFALSNIPAGAVIQSATLNLALVESDATATATYSIGVHKIINRNPDLARATGMTYNGTNAWTANSCCADNVPLAQADISAAYDTVAVNKTLGYKVWDITAMVREWMSNPSSNFGLLVNSDATKGADRYRFFASMEHPTASLRPYLSVTYTLP